MAERKIKRRIRAIDSRDGAGVRIRRSIGNTEATRIDPFLMLDNFSSDNPDDYIAGFPAHPHRGFETVTYMIDGLMRHRDHMGNEGILRSGGVQWMTAGRGVIHEEMPQQESGLMRGFQLWVNLPASEKMKPAAYQNLEPEEIPRVDLTPGVEARLVAGQLKTDETVAEGPISGISRDPLFVDLQLQPQSKIQLETREGQSLFVYLFEGAAQIGDETLKLNEAAELTDGAVLQLSSADESARMLVVGADPINEPIAQYGPFVMNTPAEIEQALADYRANRLTA